MAKERKVLDCRLYPSDMNCSIAISGREDEVIDVAMDHMVKVHGHEDTPETRKELHSILKPAKD